MTKQVQFIADELSVLAWSASVQRAGIYSQLTDRKSVGNFRDDVTAFLANSVLPQYRKRILESQHYRNIDDLVCFASTAGRRVLGAPGYKYGTAQKLLNLTLKYYWCAGFLDEPPHCPVDRIVIEQTRLKGQVNWTQFVKRVQYRQVIEAIREMATAAGQSIAVWELENFSRRQIPTALNVNVTSS